VTHGSLTGAWKSHAPEFFNLYARRQAAAARPATTQRPTITLQEARPVLMQAAKANAKR